MTTPSDSWPRIEECFLSLSASSLPLMSLCPLTHEMCVSSCLDSRDLRALWILASMCDLGPVVPESKFSTVLMTGLQSDRMASMSVSSWASSARATPSSSPSMWVAFVPRYELLDSSLRFRSLSGLVGFEQNAPAALLSRPDPSVKATFHLSSSSRSLILVSQIIQGVSFVPSSGSLCCRFWICFFPLWKSHTISLSPFSPVEARISSRHVL